MSVKSEIVGLLDSAVKKVDEIEGVANDELGRLREFLAKCRAEVSTVPEGTEKPKDAPKSKAKA